MIADKLLQKGIYWNRTWSLVDGCTPISEGCQHDWLAGIYWRFKEKSDYKDLAILKNGIPTCSGIIRFREDRFNVPLKIKKPQVFAIWSDLFHEIVSHEFIIYAFGVMKTAKQHTFLILTKRPQRIEKMLYKWNFDKELYLLSNVFFGITVENQQRAHERIPYLLQVPGKRFISFEPLLSNIDFRVVFWGMNLDFSKVEINQIIVGAESGPHRRFCNVEWIRSVVRQCKEANIPCFVKQIHDSKGKIIKDINLFPEDIKVRELAWNK
ncbi:MAG: DUF5131 family protein [Candidatus Omnitrophota bacterium]